MSKNIEKIILIFILFLVLIFWTLPALALEITYPQLPGGISLPEEPKLQEYVRYLYAFSISVAGLIALGTLIYGGFRYLISTGNPGAMMAARDQIGAGITGTIILLTSYIILVTISPQYVLFPELKYEPEEVPEYVIPPSEVRPIKDIAFQIPLGKIIERTILSGEAKNQLQQLQNLNNQIRELTRKLDSKVFDLKKEIDTCNCDLSQCDANCASVGCSAQCNIQAIQNKINDIKNSSELRELREKKSEIVPLIGQIRKNVNELYKAVFLTTIFAKDIRDYYTFAIEREVVSKEREVEIETFPGWKNILLEDERKADPATFYFWLTYEEMRNAINFANQMGGDYDFLPPGVGIPPNAICLPPDAEPDKLILPAVDAKITQKWGAASCEIYQSCFHNGLDIVGDPILAAADGEIVDINTGCLSGCDVLNNPGDPACQCGGKYGNWILIQHEDPPVYTFYAHLNDISVTPGQKVKQGQQIGTMGATGYVSGAHLHFMVFIETPAVAGTSPNKTISGNHTDPMYYITGEAPPICRGGGGRCEIITDPDNPCAVENLLPYFGVKAQEASQICNAESGGNIWELNQGCLKDDYDYSVGLFQINLYRTKRCDAVGIPENEIFVEISPATCKWKDPITSPIKAKQCAEKYGLGNAEVNINWAKQFSADGNNWCPWSTACPQSCNLCPNPAPGQCSF